MSGTDAIMCAQNRAWYGKLVMGSNLTAPGGQSRSPIALDRT